MSGYSDGYDAHVSKASITVHEEARSAKVTYRDPATNKTFKVTVHQKPNPIGFHARLPGGRR